MKTNKIILSILACLTLASCDNPGSSSPNSTVSDNSKKLTSKVLESIQDNITIQGSYDIVYEAYPDKTQTVTTLQILEENKFYVHEASGDDSYDIHYVNYNNFVAMQYIGVENTIQTQYLTDELENLVSWEAFAYPFASFTINDFKEVSSGIYTIPDQQKAINFVGAAYGYTHDKINSISLEVSDYKITKLSFETEYSEDMYGQSLKHVANLEFKDHHTAKAPALKPYETRPEHARLKTAMSKINTENVTVMMDHNDATFGHKQYNIYYNADTYYSDEPITDDNNKEYTLGVMSRQGYNYEFVKYQNEDAVLHSSPTYDFYSSYPNFEFAPELLEYVGDNTFKTYTNSVSIVGELVGVENRGLIATSVEIKITDSDEIEYVKYDYDAYGFAGTDTLKFKDSGSTTIPVDLTALEAEINTTLSISENLLDNAFSGTIEEVEYTIAITRMGVYVTVGSGEEEKTYLSQINTISDDGKVMNISYTDDANNTITYDLSETVNGEDVVVLSVTVNGSTYTFEPQADVSPEVFESFPAEVLQEIFINEIPEFTDGQMYVCLFDEGFCEMNVIGDQITLESDKAYAEILRAAGFTIDDSEYETSHTIYAEKEGTDSMIMIEFGAVEDEEGIYLYIVIMEG